jgi:ribonuclease VapC
MSDDLIAVDTSALIAIVLNEPERKRLLDCIAPCEQALISSASLLEARLVIYGKQGHAGYLLLEQLLNKRVFKVVAQSKEEIDTAYEAFLLYGKGHGNKAQLNFGDLFSYALAKTRGIPLLYKGDDFANTDIRSAVTNLG